MSDEVTTPLGLGAGAPAAAPAASLLGRDLLSIADLSREAIVEVLEVAEAFAEVSRREVPKVPTLRGRQVTSLFFEESTRTRLSFETAARRLSADVASLAVATSSVKKGESLRDTVETVEALGADVVVVRHRAAGAPVQVARWVRHARVVNAGDGSHEHPSQALLDAFTVRAALCAQRGLVAEGSGATVFDGLRVLIVGDVRHSRVARSEVLAYRSLGATVTLCAPGTLLPRDARDWGVGVADDLDDALGEADVVSLLRLQVERGSGTFVPTLAEYTATHGLTARRYELLKPHAVITHPGPMTRGVEIASSVADAPNALMSRQVENGVSVRMAILFLVLGGAPTLLGGGS
jgi:aspartate carbamoyltransferase catalytic subunit